MSRNRIRVSLHKTCFSKRETSLGKLGNENNQMRRARLVKGHALQVATFGLVGASPWRVITAIGRRRSESKNNAESVGTK